jgi:hypothetical protein
VRNSAVKDPWRELSGSCRLHLCSPHPDCRPTPTFVMRARRKKAKSNTWVGYSGWKGQTQRDTCLVANLWMLAPPPPICGALRSASSTFVGAATQLRQSRRVVRAFHVAAVRCNGSAAGSSSSSERADTVPKFGKAEVRPAQCSC